MLPWFLWFHLFGVCTLPSVPFLSHINLSLSQTTNFLTFVLPVFLPDPTKGEGVSRWFCTNSTTSMGINPSQHYWITHHLESTLFCDPGEKVIFYELIWINSSYHGCVAWEIRNKYLIETKIREQRLTPNCWEHIEPQVKSIKVLIKHIWLN